MLVKGWLWFRQTSTLIGLPVTFLLLMLGIQKFLFTASCETIGWKCEYSIGASGAALDYIDNMLKEPLDEPPILNRGKK